MILERIAPHKLCEMATTKKELKQQAAIDRKEWRAVNSVINDLVKRARLRGALVSDTVETNSGVVELGPSGNLIVDSLFVGTNSDL